MKPTKVYPPVRFCIYCGSTASPLSKEHILAYGLGGTLVLPRASCQKCAAKTKGFEETVLRRMFGPFRIRVDMPTRHAEQRPDKLPVEVVKRDGSVSVICIDAKEHPGSIVFPVYSEPGVLVGRDNNVSFRMGLCSSTFDFPRVKALVETHGGKGFSFGVADFNAMARLLAKTAYAYCFAEFGGSIGEFGGVRAGYRPLVLDLIAGDPNCCPTRCVGCVSGDPVAAPEAALAQAKEKSSPVTRLDTDHDSTVDIDEAKKAASDLFDKLDTDKEGSLSIKELRGRLSSRDFSAADPDKDKTVSKDEYMAAVEQRFKAADADGDGTVSAEEFRTPAGQALARLLHP